jgi:hypothetical protein
MVMNASTGLRAPATTLHVVRLRAEWAWIPTSRAAANVSRSQVPGDELLRATALGPATGIGSGVCSVTLDGTPVRGGLHFRPYRVTIRRIRFFIRTACFCDCRTSTASCASRTREQVETWLLPPSRIQHTHNRSSGPQTANHEQGLRRTSADPSLFRSATPPHHPDGLDLTKRVPA